MIIQDNQIKSVNEVVVAQVNNDTDRFEILRGVTEILTIQHRVATNTAGGATAVGSNVRPLNDVVHNSIAGASLNAATSTITLPAGTYKVSGYSSLYAVSLYQGFLATVAAPTVPIVSGSTGFAYTSTGANTVSMNLKGVFTLAAPTDIQMRIYTSTARNVDGLGNAVNSGIDNVHASLTFEKIS